jgi:acyl carrier protein
MDEKTVRETIRHYITHELFYDKGYDLLDDEPMITENLMDSFALAELAVYVEQEFDVYIPDPDLTVEKMNTLNLIIARVMRDLE